MLTLSADILPQTDLAYVAFRAAFHETLERIVLAQQVSLCGEWTFGYLTEAPFLTEVAPQVQLDLLLDTWIRHHDSGEWEAGLLDESVVFAVCETAARLSRNDPAALADFLADGPRTIDLQLRPALAQRFVELHSAFCQDGDFLLLSQFLDLPPREARTLKAEFGLRPRDCDPLFEALGRWHVGPDFIARSRGLLTPHEAETAREILRGCGCHVG